MAPAPAHDEGCAPNTWPDRKNGLVCSECAVLVNNFKNYGSCNGYCSAIGRVCTGAWDEVSDTCEVKYASTCNGNVGGTSDAICECGGGDKDTNEQY